MIIDKIARYGMSLLAACMLTLPAAAQDDRGKVELTTPGGKILVDYGRPQLKGRDPLTWQKVGDYWRMGNNNMTTLQTPVSLMFGQAKLDKGTYGLWLLKTSAERYELVLNSNASGMGMNHEKSKDVLSVPLKKEAAAKAVEIYTIELKNAAQGGTFVMTWGNVKLSADFVFGK